MVDGATQAQPSASAPPVASAHLPTDMLDAVRGATALYVMANHARFFLFVSAASALALGLHGVTRLEVDAALATRYARQAVLAFFLVSGYAIHYRQAFSLAETRSFSMDWRKYAMHRVRRLYPPLIMALGITFVLGTLGAHIYRDMYLGLVPILDWPTDHTISMSGLVGTLLFVQTVFTPVFGGNNPLWSLAYEGFYYVTYPLVLLANRRLGPTRCLLLFAGVGLGAALLGDSMHYRGTYQPVLSYWPVWVAGAFIADVRAGRIRVSNSLWGVGGAIGVACLATLAVMPVATMNRHSVPGGDIPWVLAFFTLLGWLVARKHSAEVRDRALKLASPLLKLGNMSYSLYVVHYPILALLGALWLSHHSDLPRTPWLMLSGITVSLSVAWCVYRVAERPFTARGRRVRRDHAGTPLIALNASTVEYRPKTPVIVASPD